MCVKLKRDKNAYTDDVRKAILLLQCEAGVSAANVAKVIDVVSTYIFHHKFEDNLPSAQTALNICDEGFVLSNIQSTEAILSSENITLHSDATSRDHKKILGHQLTVDSGDHYFLGYTPVASEDSDTLVEVTLEVFKTMVESYEDVTNVPPDVLLKQILSKLTSTMTDRAAAVKLFSRKLEAHLKEEFGCDHKLNFEHCNAHFLLGLSGACEKALSSKEREFGVLGREKSGKFSHFANVTESATGRLIRTLCETVGPRGDQKNGCAGEWTVFCKQSIIPSFSVKCNRFNCVFEAAAAIVHHLQTLRSGVLRDDINLKTQSVSLDVQDDTMVCLLCAVAFFYLKVTGPYWKLVNSTKITYSQFHVHVQKMRYEFKDLLDQPKKFFDPSFKSVFGDELNIISPTWDSVHEFIKTHDSDIVSEICKVLICECNIVLDRQLSDFLPSSRWMFVQT